MKNSLPKSSASASPSAFAPGGAESAEQLLRRLEWTVLRRLDGLLQGDWRTMMRGTGMDLADLREYQHHDDVRHIDWNVTARLAQPHVRVFTEDREMSAWFLLDLSASIDFGSGNQNKREVSTQFVALMARLLTRHGNRVGALLYGAGIAPADAFIPARSSRAHVLRLLHQMQSDALPLTRSGKPPSKGVDGPTRLHELLESAAHLIKRRSTLFVLSDFISEPGWEKPLGLLARRHDVVAVRLLDPLELELPDLGLLPIRDVETGEQLLVDTHDAGFRRRFARIAAQREADLRQSLAQAGVDTLELSTDGDMADALLRFTGLRRRRSRKMPSNATADNHLTSTDSKANA